MCLSVQCFFSDSVANSKICKQLLRDLCLNERISEWIDKITYNFTFFVNSQYGFRVANVTACLRVCVCVCLCLCLFVSMSPDSPLQSACNILALAETWRRAWGDGKNFAAQIFQWLFKGKDFHFLFFAAQNFWRPFLVIDSILSIFLSFLCLFCLKSLMYNIIYMTLFLTKIFKILTKNLDFRTKTSSLTPFLVSSYFSSHPITALLKILGGGYMGLPPPQILGRPSPQSPLSLRPCILER